MTTTDILCTRCGANPRLKRLDKNSGTGVECDCEGAKYHMDSVPFELTIHDLPDGWIVDQSGREPDDIEEAESILRDALGDDYEEL